MSTASSNSEDDCAFYLVFAVPELLSSIYSLLVKADHVGVAYRSRRAFAYTAPFIWEDVDLMHLLLLIPESSNNLDDTDIDYYTFEIPAKFDLSRLKFYSRYTRVLRAAMPCSVDFPSSDLQSPAEPLPPSLERLLIRTYSCTGAKIFNWIHGFLTSSLREFRFSAKSIFGPERSRCSGFWGVNPDAPESSRCSRACAP